MINLVRSKGVGLIEVLVTLLLLSTSLLAIATLQTRSLQFNQSAYLRSQANILAYDIIDRMRVNRDEVKNYSLNFDDDPPTGSTLADADMNGWLTQVQALLPDGEAEIACDDHAAGGVEVVKCKVSLRWTEKSLFGDVEEDELDDEARTTFTYSTSL